MGGLLDKAAEIKNNKFKGKQSKVQDEEKEQSKIEQADSLQMVLPNIYMGSAKAAHDLKLLKSVGVSHVLAIGWNLTANFPDDFKYLLVNKIEDRPGYILLKHFPQCFAFMDECLGNVEDNMSLSLAASGLKRSLSPVQSPNSDDLKSEEPHSARSTSVERPTLFVHCHKGLSRSASIIIGYEMYRHKKSFEHTLVAIREYRSFIMPNIGFQAQLKKFEQMNYSLDMNDYKDLDVIEEIEGILPSILEAIKEFYKAFANEDEINEKDMFAKTMYIHQAHKMAAKGKLPDKYVEIVDEAIEYLRKIQVEFVGDETSIKRFNEMFQ